MTSPIARPAVVDGDALLAMLRTQNPLLPLRLAAMHICADSWAQLLGRLGDDVAAEAVLVMSLHGLTVEPLTAELVREGLALRHTRAGDSSRRHALVLAHRLGAQLVTDDGALLSADLPVPVIDHRTFLSEVPGPA